MKFSVNWLKKWVDLDIDVRELERRLTSSGLEVDAVTPVASEFEGVVVAGIESCEPHPDADKLSVCTVNDGSGQLLKIVCGAPNAREGIRVPLARVGAKIGPDFKIKKARLRGVESAGMLCSARELGLSEDHSGLMELPANAPLGENLHEWLELDDYSIEIDLTPNRADCLSIKGLARDVSASCQAEFVEHEIPAVPPQIDDSIPIRLDSPENCPRYAGRIIRGIDPAARTPLWMQEALRRCGLRSIGPVVDVTNYVLIELGQPMHAFDLARIEREIVVRQGKPGEQLVLLDGSEVTLDEDILTICDASGPIALAGIMGGEPTSVSDSTVDILLESAWFRPGAIMGKARRYGMHTDASHRFERGVDPQLQVPAIEYATSLLMSICGGKPGPVMLAEESSRVPSNRPVQLRHGRLNRLVGMEFDREAVEGVLKRLGMSVVAQGEEWTVTAPPARMDIEIEEDLIEEIARIVGYDQIPEQAPRGVLGVGTVARHDVPLEHLQQSMCAAGYQEAINYSFVDRRQLEALHQAGEALPLANPLTAEMDVMRTTLMPGLLANLKHNVRRQQGRVRLFETGLAYIQQDSLSEIPRIAAVAAGSAWPEQWSEKSRGMDYFDVKGDVERLVALRGGEKASFRPSTHAWLHPGASAQVVLDGQEIGWCGALHPSVLKALDVEGEVLAFELDLQPLQTREVPFAKEISRFPSLRRDLAFWVPETVTFAEIRASVLDSTGELLQNLVVFDVYHDQKLKKGYKSVAIGLILQHVSSTLTDESVEPVIQRAVAGLETSLGAYLRG